MIDRELNYGRTVIQRLLQQSGPCFKILDIGAGKGDDLLAAKRLNPGAELHAVEVFPPNAAHLRSLGIRVHEINIEVEEIPLETGSVDLVISNQTFEHIKEVFWVLHEASRVLKTGGHLLVGVPNLASLHNRVLLMMGRQPSSIKNNSAHIRGYTRRDFVNLVRCFPDGYELQSWGGSNFYPLPPVFARPAAKLFPSMAWAVFMLFTKTREYSREYLDFPRITELETNFFLGKNQ